MIISKDRRIVAGFVLALLILLLVGGVSYRSTRRLASTAEWVAHTHEALSTIHALLASVGDAQGGGRAYVITGKDEHLEPYREALPAVDRELRDLRRLTADNRSQQKRLDAAQALIARRLALLQESIERYRSDRSDRALQISLTDQGKELMDQIQDILGDMEHEENRLLAQREAQADLSARHTTLVIVLGSASAILLIGLMSLLLHRETRERRRAKESVRQSEERLRAILDNSPAVIYVKDTEGRFVLINRQFETLFHLDADSVKGKTDHDLFPKEIADSYRANDLKVLKAGRSLEWEEVAPLDDGLHTYFSVKFPLRGLRGLPEAVCGISTDITTRKRAEEEARQLNQELAEKVTELTVVNKELETFSYSVSHDLRAPLRHINGFVDLLQKSIRTELDEKSRRYLHTIADSATRMGRLIDDLLAFSRMGRVEMLEARVSLDGLVQEVVEEVKGHAQQRRIEWNIAALPETRGDPAMLRVVLVNLIANAVKYTKPREQARIEIGSIPQNGQAVLFVRDNGVGFDMKYADKLFGVFQRLHRADEFEGTGIGLATARRIVHRHGGRTWAEGAVDQGATFFFSLPRRA